MCRYVSRVVVSFNIHLSPRQRKKHLPPVNFPLDHFPASCHERRIIIGPQFFSATSAFRSALISSMLMVSGYQSVSIFSQHQVVNTIPLDPIPPCRSAPPHIILRISVHRTSSHIPPPLIFSRPCTADPRRILH